MTPVPNPPAGNPPPSPDGTTGGATPHAVPVPPHVIAQALREFNEDELAAGVREIRAGGGLTLGDFYPELDPPVGPGK